MFKRVLAATFAAFFVSLRKETRRAIGKFTRRVTFVVVGIFAMLFLLVMLNFFMLAVVISNA